MIAVASPLTIAQKGLTSAIYAKDQITASYLAQDAIEYLRNWSDQNVGASTTLVPIGWLDGITKDSLDGNLCGSANDVSQCKVNTRYDYNKTEGITACDNSGCPNLKYSDSDGIYDYNSSKKDSPFVRSVTVKEINTGIEALITVTVSWKDKGKDRDLTVSTGIFNWRLID